VRPHPTSSRCWYRRTSEPEYEPRRYRLLRHFASAVYLIEDVPVVARVAYGPGSAERARTAITTAGWLAGIGFPATEPAALSGEQPMVFSESAEVAVTFWRYYPQPSEAPEWDPGVLGDLARRLHGLTSVPPASLPRFQPLRSISRALDRAAAEAIYEDSLRWLRRRINVLEEYDELEFPLGEGMIHADMYTGNLLEASGAHPAVLGDWDSVCIGPREIDLIPTCTATRFGLPVASVDRFVAAYGYDLRN
jgi:aminoglycoside phosphotransferase (APT) family kinase protein